MKKFLCLTISLILIICGFSGCKDNTQQPVLDITDNSQITGTNEVVSSENKTENSSSDSTQTDNSNDTNTGASSDYSKNNTTSSSNRPTIQNNTNKDNSKTSSNVTTSQTTQDNTTTSSDVTTSSNQAHIDINNGVLKKATAQEMNVPENIKLIGTDDATEENNSDKIKATVAAYELDGNIVNWKTQNDLLYVITSGNNRLVVINSKDMKPVDNVPLAGKPAEINIVGNEIYISLPDLCRIDVFSKSDYTKTNSLYFDHEVSSFCIDGDYIYYSEHDQHCRVFKKNMATNDVIQISREYYYFPKLYLNKEDNILYIGETRCTGCKLYYYDANTLELKSKFSKNDYGMMNHTREIFHVGDEIFWGNYRFSDTNAKQIIGRYGEGNYGSVTFASSEIVSTYEGLFLTDTYECIINYLDSGFEYEYIILTESHNIFFRSRNVNNDTIIGINFNIQ